MNSSTSLPSIHNLSFTKLNSKEKISFSAYAGKKILIVNVASKCGFTKQYEGLQELSEKYKDKLVVVGFPCNQFLFQESTSEDSIAQFCSLNYGVTFPMSTKVKTKGIFKDTVYKWLTSKRLNGVGDFSVSWNFNKFLLNEKGQLVAHFESKVEPLDKQLTDLIAQ
jgi:glutathione peroxidase